MAGNKGTAVADFGPWPGESFVTVAITSETGITSGAAVEAWVRPTDTADHTADEHKVAPLIVTAGDVVAGTGFTINVHYNGPSLTYGQWALWWVWSS